MLTILTLCDYAYHSLRRLEIIWCARGDDRPRRSSYPFPWDKLIDPNAIQPRHPKPKGDISVPMYLPMPGHHGGVFNAPGQRPGRSRHISTENIKGGMHGSAPRVVVVHVFEEANDERFLWAADLCNDIFGET